MGMSREIKGLSERPLIMGILNITPDSFSDGGRFFDWDKAVAHALHMVDDGADIIDIGGESSRPGAENVSIQEELDRVIPVIKEIHAKTKVPISIDTVKADVAEAAIKAGASIINDISGLENDPSIADVAAKHKSYLILMHMRGTPGNMQENTEYDDIIGEISLFLESAGRKAEQAGVKKEKIIIDPGIGFGKSADGNFRILKNLEKFLKLDYPVLIGASRKSFIGKTFGLDIDERLEGSLAAACYAVLNGADIVRVHDVKETKKALDVLERITIA